MGKRYAIKHTEQSIQKILRQYYLSQPKYIIENLYVFKWESDFLAKTHAGYWHEVEIKISFADFKNDAKNKKEKFEILETGKYHHRGQLFQLNIHRPNYFSYCVTEDMVDKVLPLIPEYAGLLYVSKISNTLCTVKQPKKLHDLKIEDKDLRLTDKFYYNYREWKNYCETFPKREKELKEQIQFMKQEFKAETGHDFNEIF